MIVPISWTTSLILSLNMSPINVVVAIAVSRDTHSSLNGTGFAQSLLVHPITRKDVMYGPQHGVDVKNWHLPKNWDDINHITIPGSSGHRELSSVKCSFQQFDYGGPILDAITNTYTGPDGDEDSEPRGFLDHLGFYKSKFRRIGLSGAGDYFTSFRVRDCGGLFFGIHITTHFNPKGIKCGQVDVKPDRPRNDCLPVVELRPPPGRRVVGLYGDENKVVLTDNEGLRGLGLITMAIP